MLSQSLFLLLVACTGIHGYHMVAAPKGTCTTWRAYAKIGMIRSQCATMGGAWNENPGASEWIKCHLDWCDVPSSGSVSSQSAWGIDVDQSSTTTSSSRTYGIIETIRQDCDNIKGRYNGNPKADQWIGCHLYMIRMDGRDRNNIHTLVISGVGECPNKVAYGILEMIHRQCLQVGGKWNGNPGANDWIKCHLDICVSPVIDCQPSDLWSTLQVCRNPSSSSFTCEFILTTGIKKGEFSTSTTGGSEVSSITAEVGVELAGIFTSSVLATLTTGFNWANTVGSNTVWSKATTRKLSVALTPNQAVSINQVVGVCGDYRIQTYEYSVVDV